MKKISLILAFSLVLVAFGCTPAATSALQASGQVQATQVSVAAETAGRVVAISVKEGDTVKTGDTLFQLDGSLLQAQQQAAQAELAAANASVQAAQASLATYQAQYDIALSDALAAAQPDRLQSWKQTQPGAFNQPSWYFSKDEQIQAAQAEVDAAKTAMNDAQASLTDVEQKSGSANFLQVEKDLANARTAYDAAQTVLDQTNGATNGASLHDAAQTSLDNANTNLKNSQKAYDDALTTTGAEDVLNARAKLEVASERYYTALDAQRALQTGENALSVVAASKSVDQAKAMLAQAQSSVTASQAQLDLIQAQMNQLTVTAPMDGVVLVSSVEVGEVLQAGVTALTIGQLNPLKVTVYIPENQYGQISLGQQASLSVDSFPNRSFTARVTRIADQAEYTPQNVQTQEGRQTTVYAIDLSVDNPNGDLKPGMPADVTFSSSAK